MHVRLPPHVASLQPPNVDPMLGAAVRVTDVPAAKAAEQVLPQLMPAGALVTVPVPVPALLTVNVLVPSGALKFAVTVWLPFIVTVQGPVPLQPPPLQPVKIAPPAVVAVNVTKLPAGKLAEHTAPQLIPAGVLVTVPLAAPVPVLLTVNVFMLGRAVKVAVTD